MIDVLIVDDEAPFRRLLHRWIESAGLGAEEGESAEQALLIASQTSPRAVLCDINMPRGQTGFWLIEQLHRLHPETAVIVTTGLNDFGAALTGLRAHVTDYLVKPFPRERLQQALTAAFAEHESRAAAAAALRQVKGDVRVADGHATSVAALLAVLQAENADRMRHAQRVSDVAVEIAEALGLPEQERFHIGHAALLREIERLDVHGIARKVPFLAAAASIAVAVEERFDGTGFPLRLAGAAIPLGARVVAVSDAVVRRSPRPGATPPEALRAVDGGRGTQFDPAVLDALHRVIQRRPAPALV